MAPALHVGASLSRLSWSRQLSTDYLIDRICRSLFAFALVPAAVSRALVRVSVMTSWRRLRTREESSRSDQRRSVQGAALAWLGLAAAFSARLNIGEVRPGRSRRPQPSLPDRCETSWWRFGGAVSRSRRQPLAAGRPVFAGRMATCRAAPSSRLTWPNGSGYPFEPELDLLRVSQWVDLIRASGPRRGAAHVFAATAAERAAPLPRGVPADAPRARARAAGSS